MQATSGVMSVAVARGWAHGQATARACRLRGGMPGSPRGVDDGAVLDVAERAHPHRVEVAPQNAAIPDGGLQRAAASSTVQCHNGAHEKLRASMAPRAAVLLVLLRCTPASAVPCQRCTAVQIRAAPPTAGHASGEAWEGPPPAQTGPHRRPPPHWAPPTYQGPWWAPGCPG